MAKLYSALALAYHEMYQSIFDYKKDFQYYHHFLQKHKCQKVLEIGCGSGNLTPFFLKKGYKYLGLDLSKEMLAIAKEVAPKAKFVQGDMRHVKLRQKFDAVVISGRSFTYMTTNKDVMNALSSINKVLKKDGLFIFENFNAEEIISIKKKKFVQTAKYNGTKYKRVSTKTLNLKEGWTENWCAEYRITKNGKTKVVKDKSILRSFTKDELNLFLKLNKFSVMKNQRKGFELRIVAQKR